MMAMYSMMVWVGWWQILKWIFKKYNCIGRGKREGKSIR